jgi:hypothetical protein
MDFNILVKTQLFPIFQKYGFEIKEEFKNILRFQSSIIEINIVFNNYEKSCCISIGKNGDPLYELRNNAVKELFNSSLSIEQITPEAFVQNLSILFETKEGNEILKGNIEKIKISEDENYTSELIRRQVLNVASKAWRNNDYITFVKSIDTIGVNYIPQSYLLKYKIAKQKIIAIKHKNRM